MARSISSEDLATLAAALADGEWHSGEVLAEGFGITRAGLAKRLGHLREWGLVVETRSGLGYRLAQALEPLVPEQLQAIAGHRLDIQVLPSVDSTNRLLAEASPDQDPQALLAEYQSAGRGRRGRRWQSPFGANLYLSLAWNWNLWPKQLPALSLVVGVVCARTLQGLGLDSIRLKWPNDLWVAQKKLGGILIEQTGEVGGACRVIIGIGINVSMRDEQAAEVDQAWTSVDAELTALGKARISRNALAGHLLRNLQQALDGFGDEGFAPWQEAWQALDALEGQPVTVPDDPTLQGLGRGLDADGAYRIETAQGLRRVHAGDVSLRPAK